MVGASPSQPASNAAEQPPQTPSPVEQRTEERKQLIATSAGQFLLWLPIDLRADAGEQSPQVHIIETQLEQTSGETEPVIAASASSEQLELSWPSKATTDAGEQLPETQTVEAPLEQKPQELQQVIATPPADIKPDAPSEIASDAPEKSSQTQLTESDPDESTDASGTDTTLFQTEELVFVPWRTDEPLEAILPAAETAARKELDEIPAASTVEVCNQPEEPHTEPSAPAAARLEDKPAENPTVLEMPVKEVASETDAKVSPAPAVPDDRLGQSGEAPSTPKPEEQAQKSAAPVEVRNEHEKPHTEPSTPAVACCVNKSAENPAALEAPVEKVASEADAKISPAPAPPPERLDITAPVPETLPLEEQTNTPPAPVAEVCKPEEPHAPESTAAGAPCNEQSTVDKPAEKPIPLEAPPGQSASDAYAMIPPAPSAPVPGRAEFVARLHALANPQSKESFVEKEPIELLPGLVAGSLAECESPTDKPAERHAVTVSPSTDEAVEETKAASVSPPPANETSIAEVREPVERATMSDVTTKPEECLEQTLVLEPERETASDHGEKGEAPNAILERPPKKKVLVVDDDPTLRMLLRMGLEPHGYECLLAENGKAAQAVVQAHHPVLILVDLLMPVMDGLAFVLWLRGTAKDSTPVLVFTNLDDMKITQQALDGGANAFACKPLRLKDLLQTMKELVPT